MTVSDEGAHQDRDRLLSLRLRKRCLVLQVLGAVLMILAYAVEWAPPDDLTLPSTRSFMLLIGVMVCGTGLALNEAEPVTPLTTFSAPRRYMELRTPGSLL
jgi:hypothetical protein